MNAYESLSRVGPVLRTRGLEKEYGRGAGLVRALDRVELEVTSTIADLGHYEGGINDGGAPVRH